MSKARELFEQLEAEAAAGLAAAEAKAHASGKEPFDLARFEQLLDRGSQKAREQGMRAKYYLSYPQIRTLAEFVALLHEIEPWQDSS